MTVVGKTMGEGDEAEAELNRYLTLRSDKNRKTGR